MAEKIPVEMTDGRTVGFNLKQKLVKESIFTEDGISIRLDFRNGETRLFTLRPNMLTRFAAHGAEQKLGDEMAGETDIADAVLAVDDLIKRLDNGDWTQTRAAGSFTGTSVLMRALMEASGKSGEEVKAFLEGKTQAEKLALRRSDKLRSIIERLEADKVSKGSSIDTDSLLGELGLPSGEAKSKK